MGEVHGSTKDASRTHVSYSRWVVSLDIEKLLPDIHGFLLDEVERDRLFRVSPDQSRL